MFSLHVDTPRWRRHLDQFVEQNRGIVPVIKGNGYGFGRDLLCAESDRIGIELIAVGTYGEVADALAASKADVLVLTPWRPFLDDVTYDDRVIHTVGRTDDVAALAEQHPGTRVVVEGETSMSRHGFDRHELAGAKAVLGDLVVEGFTIHLPLTTPAPGANLAEAQSWAGALQASQLDTTTLFVSHLTAAELAELAATRPQLTVRPRVGTALWLGDLGALSVQALVLDRHAVTRGERVGYRQRSMPRDGVLLVVAGGTSHGVGLEAPKAGGGVVQRSKALAKGGLEAAGLSLSPFTINGKQRWFAEPPHMHISMLFLPGQHPTPQVGDVVDVAVRYTTATFDRVLLDG